MLMDGRTPHTARGLDLTIGPMIGVKQAQGFGHAFLEIAAIALEGLGAADIHLPQIKGRLAFGDPMRKRHARAARRHDPDGVVARRDPITFEFRRLAQIVAIIGGKAFGAVEEGVDARRLEHRHALGRHLEDRLEMLEILWQRVEAEIFRNAAHAPWLGAWFKRAQHHLARVRFVIGAFVGHPQNRQMPKPFNGFCHEVKVLAGMERQGHARRCGQIAAPHAAAVDHDIGGDMALLRAIVPIHAGRAHPVIGHGGNLDPLDDLGARHPRALGQRHGDIGRVALPVERQMQRAGDIADLDMRIHGAHLGGGDLMHLDTKGAGNRGLPQQFLAPVGGQTQRDGADLPHARRNTGFGLELGVKICRVFRQARHVLAAAQLAHQPRRMPSGAAGQLFAFQKHDVGPAKLGQMIGDRTAGDAAADDHCACVGRRCCHDQALSLVLSASQSGRSSCTTALQRWP